MISPYGHNYTFMVVLVLFVILTLYCAISLLAFPKSRIHKGHTCVDQDLNMIAC